MAKGRQRRRDIQLARKAAEAGLAGLSPQALTSIISDDDNDLDNVSFSTTDGATTTIKNNRIKDSKPRKRGFAPLGDTAPALTGSNLGGRKGYTPGNDMMSDGSTTRSNLGGRKGYMPGNGNMQSNGPTSRQAMSLMDEELMMAENLGGRKGYRPGNQSNMMSDGSTTRSNLGERKNYMPGQDTLGTPGGDNRGGRKGYMPGTLVDAGTGGRSANGFNLDDELLLQGGPNVRGSAIPKQAKALTDFIGEDLTPVTNEMVTVAMDSDEDIAFGTDDRVISETINDDGSVTYELAPSNMGEPEVTTAPLTNAQLEPGMYEGVEPGQETALTGTLDNKGYNFDSEGNAIAEEPIFGRQTDDQKAVAGITMEEQLKERELLRQLEKETRASNDALLGDDSTTIDGEGSLDNQSVGMLEDGSMPGLEGDVPGYEGVKEPGRRGYKPGEETLGLTLEQEELLGFEGRKNSTPGNGNDGVDQDALYEAPGYEGVKEPGPEMEMDGYEEEAKAAPELKAAGSSTVGEVAEEAKKAENDIQAAQAGNPHLEAVTEDAKAKVEDVKAKVESGELAPETAADMIKGSLGQLGELLGIDGKDLIRGLFRYAGARIFGMSGNEAGRFMYEGFMGDEAAEAKVLADKNANMGLGSNATAQQKNLNAYKEEVKRIDNDTTLSAEQKTAAKKTADEMFGINQGTSMGRPVNIQARRADGTEEVVAGRRNDNNSYDVYLDGQWVPIEESGLSEVQITGRNANQALEAGAKDMRQGGDGVSIPNAYSVGKDGSPLFKMKTEQAKRYGLIKRAVDNFPVVAEMMSRPEVQEDITSLMGGLETWAAKNSNAAITPAVIATLAKDSVPKIYASATASWLQALLRADTGAAYTGTEIADYIGTNIPSVGDAGAPTEFKINQMSKATKALIPGAGEAAPYLMGIMDGSIRPDDDAIKGVDIARKAIEAKYGVSNDTASVATPDGLSDDELAAWNNY